jgi:hypothetical protein
MTSRDICDHIAELLIDMPSEATPESGVDDLILNDLKWEAHARREARAQELRLSWEEGNQDPLIDAIFEARARMYAAERDLRLPVAFGREFVRPRPYRLETLAEASGMSISGVRTAYEDEEIQEVAKRTGLKPHSDGAPAARRRVRRDVTRRPRRELP